jgi:drug/metabolite transporter (DMT)-like permease
MKQRGLLLVLFTAIISGFSIFVNKFGISGINPYIFTWSKNIVAVIFLFSTIILLNKFKELARIKAANWFKLIAIGLIGGSIPFLLFFKGLQMTAATNAAFIHKTMFVFVMVLSILFLKEKINKKVIFASVAVLIGNFLILKLSSFSFNLGDMLIFAATLLWSFEIALSKHTLKELSGEIVAFGRMFFGSLFILLFLVFTGNIKHVVALTIPQFTWILLTSVFLFLYLFTFYNGLKLVKAHIATSVLLIGSVVTTALSMFYYGTSISLSQGFGFLMLITGIMVIVGSDFKHLSKQILQRGSLNGWH